jgi:hypothetical protein
MSDASKVYQEWMAEFDGWLIGPPLEPLNCDVFNVAELVIIVASHLDIPDQISLSNTCKALYWVMNCACCNGSPCLLLQSSHHDFLRDQREAYWMYMEEMRDDDDGGDYDINWEAE